MARDEIVDVFHGDALSGINKTLYDIADTVASFFGAGDLLQSIYTGLNRMFGGKNTIPTSADVLRLIDSKTKGKVLANQALLNKLNSKISALPVSKGGNAKYYISDTLKKLDKEIQNATAKNVELENAIDLAKAGASSVDFASRTNRAKIAKDTMNDLEARISKL